MPVIDPTNFAHIPNDELIHDLQEAAADMAICQTALLLNVETYGNGESVADRVAGNQTQIDTIQQIIVHRAGNPRILELLNGS